MRTLFLFLLLLFTLSVFSQTKGFVPYRNSGYDSTFKFFFPEKYDIHPKNLLIINLKKNKEISQIIHDYQKLFQEFNPQIKSLTFLDHYKFKKLDTTGMRTQKLCYIQSKFDDYKWWGCRTYDYLHISSEVYFTTIVREYFDRWEIEILIAEKTI